MTLNEYNAIIDAIDYGRLKTLLVMSDMIDKQADAWTAGNKPKREGRYFVTYKMAFHSGDAREVAIALYYREKPFDDPIWQFADSVDDETTVDVSSSIVAYMPLPEVYDR